MKVFDLAIAEKKKALRSSARKKRRQLAASAAGSDPAARAAAQFLRHVDLTDIKSVSAYWPSRDELDTRPLLLQLHAAQVRLLLPVVAGPEQPLLFRQWQPDLVLVAGDFDIPVPPESAPIAEPDLALVPLLAFDAAGFRLGYGGGFYDRTLQARRAVDKNFLALGFAYAGQEIENVPVNAYDQPLDGVISEQGLKLSPRCAPHPALRLRA